MKTTLTSVMTFVAAAAVGCGAAIAIASTAAVMQESSKAPPAPAKGVPQEVIRLEPVVVTISKTRFEAVRKDLLGDTEVARSAGGKDTRG